MRGAYLESEQSPMEQGDRDMQVGFSQVYGGRELSPLKTLRNGTRNFHVELPVKNKADEELQIQDGVHFPLRFGTEEKIEKCPVHTPRWGRVPLRLW